MAASKTSGKAPKTASSGRSPDKAKDAAKAGRKVAASPAIRTAVSKPASAPPAKKPPVPAVATQAGAATAGTQRIAKAKKPKLVRDSFTMPEEEYAVLGKVKKACLARGVAVKKSELLRVGVALVGALDDSGLDKALAALMPVKTGRPKKNQ